LKIKILLKKSFPKGQTLRKCKQTTTNQYLTRGAIKKYLLLKEDKNETPQQVPHKKVDQETKNL
jgi:hypothetical protein